MVVKVVRVLKDLNVLNDFKVLKVPNDPNVVKAFPPSALSSPAKKRAAILLATRSVGFS